MFNTHIDNSDNSITHKYPDTIKEIKAPTDDSIRLYKEFRDKAINGLYEKEITLSYKGVSELCFNGAKNFLNLLIKK